MRVKNIGLGLCLFTVALLAAAGESFAAPQDFPSQVAFYNLESVTSREQILRSGYFNDNPLPDLLIVEYCFGYRQGRAGVVFDIAKLPPGDYNMTTFQADVFIVGDEFSDLAGSTAFCDFNGDNYDDVVVTRTEYFGALQSILIFYGGPQWASGTVVEQLNDNADVIIYGDVDSSLSEQIVCGDINGDRYDDLLTAYSPVAILGADFPSGTLIDLHYESADVHFSGYRSYDLTNPLLADINGDGRNDFVFTNRDIFRGNIFVWFGFDDYSTPRDISTTRTPPDVSYKFPDYDTNYSCLHTGDYNLDGADDLLCMRWDDYTYYWDIKYGRVGMVADEQLTELFFVHTDNKSCDFGDINNDGLLDLLFAANAYYWDRTSFPSTGVWEMDDYEPQGFNQSGLFSETYAANLDNDDYTDLMFVGSNDVTISAGLYITCPVSDDDISDDDTSHDDAVDDDDDGCGC